MNYYTNLGSYYSPPRANNTGVLNSVLNVLAFASLIAFGIVSTIATAEATDGLAT